MFPGAIVLLAFILAGTVHTAAGFGSALVSVPIVSMVLGVSVATPIQALLGLSLSGLIFYQHREHWEWRESLPLIGGSIFGIPVGTYAITALPAAFMLASLGTVVLSYSVFELWRTVHGKNGSGPPEEEGNGRLPHLSAGAWITGLLSGMLGGAYAANGPPLVMYGTIKQWNKQRFKSILQSLFVVNGVLIVSWQFHRGFYTLQVGQYLLYALPGLLAGVFIGRQVDRHLNHARFRMMVLGLLTVLGTGLLIRASTV